MVSWEKLTVKELAHQSHLTDDVDKISLIEQLIIYKNSDNDMRDLYLSLETQLAKYENYQPMGNKNDRINGNSTRIKGPERTKK